MQIIISPSKTQKFNGRYFANYTIPAFIDIAEEISGMLRNYTDKELSTLMKTSANLTSATRRKLEDFASPFNPENAKQALFLFQGDAFQAIEADSYTESQLEYAQNHLYILSGLFGALRPLDLMQPYRLEMGSPLKFAGHKNLYSLWTKPLTELISKAINSDSDKVLINLASAEYSKAIQLNELPGRVVDIVFKQKSKGVYKTIAIHTKRARGMMVDYIIKGELKQAEELKGFNTGGYVYVREESTDTAWTFLQVE